MTAIADRRWDRADSALEPLLPLEQALERMLAGLEALEPERVALSEAHDRATAEALTALVTLPPWDNSAMDGFAVRAHDLANATAARPVTLPVVGEVAAGHPPPRAVDPGTAMRILTGAMLPPGADAVVPVEETDAPRGASLLPKRVRIRTSPEPGAFVRRAGSDLQAGAPLVARGTPLRSADLALLAASGHGTVLVHPRPALAVLSTGDELVQPGEPLSPGQIYDSNGVALAAQARWVGAEVSSVVTVGDQLDPLLDAVGRASREAHLLVVSGGVSVGAHDVVKEAFARIGSVDLWRVAVQPGKPLAFGHAVIDGRRLLLFGLPGNPVSSFVTFELFVRPVIRRLAGHADPLARITRSARLGEPVRKDPARRAFLRVMLEPDREDGLIARLAGAQGSHVLSALAAADGLAVVPEGVSSLEAGAQVEVWELEPRIR
ncbi:MAG: molybdopterin molybdotransferase MoeA [Chloroflexi bacterium]|nr:molybdopterin molybdotransferase MoeA [Chloroflexota bacterium]